MASNSAPELAYDEGNYITCSACKEQDKNTAADNYCVDCQDCYCSECLKLHETLPALKSHKLLDTDDDKICQLKMIPTKKCEKHNYKAVDMFCKNHDEVGCATCMATDHRTCKDVLYIPEMIRTSPDKECQESIAALEKQFYELLDRFKKEDSDLETNKQTEIDKINSYAKEIENKIKQAAEDASSQVEKRYQKLKSSVKENTVAIKEKFDDFEVIKECIGATTQNKSQAFVSFKLNKGKIAASKQACEEFSHIELGQRVQFTLDPNYKILIGNLIILGNVRIQPYSFVHKGSFDIRLPSDKFSIDIHGSCILSNGSIILADNKNNNIKMVDDKSR
ncbi:E3 ubiquitin-protein ligase TRIM33-like [Ruditapes philippinarum]|uniref:E3 ubiquitin-protein ligase TRIM33-like n=1 Tax=Ruditapes philippinarum TaxID=129788 RepID=UPI00295B507F|nr:E3 ubiquitin-protein ligase TRIM33-like [Ruditapes philippinarum]